MWWSGAVVLIFRAELVLFLGPMLLLEMYHKRIRLADVIIWGGPIAMCCLCELKKNQVLINQAGIEDRVKVL